MLQCTATSTSFNYGGCGCIVVNAGDQGRLLQSAKVKVTAISVY